MPFELHSKMYNKRIPEKNREFLAFGRFLVARAAGDCNFVLNQGVKKSLSDGFRDVCRTCKRLLKFNRSLKKWMRKY